MKHKAIDEHNCSCGRFEFTQEDLNIHLERERLKEQEEKERNKQTSLIPEFDLNEYLHHKRMERITKDLK